jgi:integrase
MKEVLIRGWDIVERASQYLSEKLELSGYTVKKHSKNWQCLYEFAKTKELSVDFNCYESVRSLIANYTLSFPEDFEQTPSFNYSLNILQEYIRDGKILTAFETTDFSGSIGQKMYEFISWKEREHLRLSTLKTYELQLSRFLKYLKAASINDDVTSINTDYIYHYIKLLPVEHKSNTYIAISVIKRFLKWLYENHYCQSNLSIMIPSGKYTQQSELPSVYSKDEIENMLEKVDRGYAAGKRDYLVLLLGARLGLRSSDICNLKFENIKWEDNVIALEQVKTSNPLNLPLLPEVGNAIIDYLRYGRPKSDLSYVVLSAKAPYVKLKSGSIYSITSNAIKTAGIDVGRRHRGPHSLRHSLAARMLEGQTTMPVISEVLGHADTTSTLYYLRIDITSLKACALETSQVPDSFYEQFKW